MAQSKISQTQSLPSEFYLSLGRQNSHVNHKQDLRQHKLEVATRAIILVEPMEGELPVDDKASQGRWSLKHAQKIVQIFGLAGQEEAKSLMAQFQRINR